MPEGCRRGGWAKRGEPHARAWVLPRGEWTQRAPASSAAVKHIGTSDSGCDDSCRREFRGTEFTSRLRVSCRLKVVLFVRSVRGGGVWNGRSVSLGTLVAPFRWTVDGASVVVGMRSHYTAFLRLVSLCLCTCGSLRRVPWIGVNRQVVLDRRRRGWHDPAAQLRGRARMEGNVNPDDFFAHQQRLVTWVGMAG